MFMRMAGHRRRQGGAAVLTLSQQVEAILSGVNGFVIDPKDTATMWEESTKVTQVSDAADPVGAIRTKYGTTPFDLVMATAGRRPSWPGAASILGDGVDDKVAAASGTTFSNGVEKLTCALRFKHTGTTSERLIFSYSSLGGAGSPRLFINRFGTAVRVQVRRLDATTNDEFTTVSCIPIDTEHTLYCEVDYAGAGVLRLWVNGVSRLNSAMTFGAADEKPLTNSARVQMMDDDTAQMNIGRVFWAPSILSAGNRTTVESWLQEFAL